jgi:hypothetical protein
MTTTIVLNTIFAAIVGAPTIVINRGGACRPWGADAADHRGHRQGAVGDWLGAVAV